MNDKRKYHFSGLAPVDKWQHDPTHDDTNRERSQGVAKEEVQLGLLQAGPASFRRVCRSESIQLTGNLPECDYGYLSKILGNHLRQDQRTSQPKLSTPKCISSLPQTIGAEISDGASAPGIACISKLE